MQPTSGRRTASPRSCWSCCWCTAGAVRGGAMRSSSRSAASRVPPGRAGRSCSGGRGPIAPRPPSSPVPRRSDAMRLRKQQRLVLVVLALLLLGGASGLVLFALSDSVAFFATPSDIASGQVDIEKRFRLGGLGGHGSLPRPGDDGLV